MTTVTPKRSFLRVADLATGDWQAVA